MTHIENAISALQKLTPDQRAILRTSVGYCIEGRTGHFPKQAPSWIDPHDYAEIRRMAITEAYKRRVAGQTWNPAKDKAFNGTQSGGTKSSIIMPHKFL